MASVKLRVEQLKLQHISSHISNIHIEHKLMRLIFKSICIILELPSMCFCDFITFNLQSHMNFPPKYFRK